jgi:hypothetical protein
MLDRYPNIFNNSFIRFTDSLEDTPYYIGEQVFRAQCIGFLLMMIS